jgi:EAL domain
LPHLPTAVNLSLAQCRNGDLASSTRRVLQASGLEPCALELEGTESLFLSPSSGHLNDLYQLHTQGVRVSIDDFGTGYSSLGAAATASRRPDQDRSVLCRWARAQSGCRGNRVCSDQAGPFARPTGCGRRRGNSRTMHIPSGGGLQRGAGFPHRPAVAAGRFRGSTRRSPLSDGAARPECARRCRAPAVPAGGPGSRSSSRILGVANLTARGVHAVVKHPLPAPRPRERFEQRAVGLRLGGGRDLARIRRDDALAAALAWKSIGIADDQHHSGSCQVPICHPYTIQ